MDEIRPGSTDAWQPDDVRRRFVAAWEAGDRPRVEEFVDVDSGDNVELFSELALEVVLRRNRGEQITFEELAARFPDHLGIVRAALRSTNSPPDPGNDDAGQPQDSVLLEHPAVGRYRVTGRIGDGGFGVVLSAFDDELHRSIAIKLPHRRFSSEIDFVKNYLNEARVLARLDHSNIVPVYDFGRTADGRPFVVSKFIEGNNLYELLRRGRPAFSVGAAIIAEIADALNYAHLQGIVHRDVKPANILIDSAGKAYLADFGIVLCEEDYGTGPTFAGTPAYMSPEQARSEGHRVDGRSDIFSLGSVFYQVLTSRRPFRAVSDAMLLQQVIECDPRPPRQSDDSIPRDLERICLKAMSKRAVDRYTTARDMADELRHWLSSESATPFGASAGGGIKGAAAPPPPPTSDMGMPNLAGVLATPSDATLNRQLMLVVPKGLRSFDAHDADFFLELLPGPRDRNGLPDSIRFWKSRIEETDAERTFPVGLIYGPSGCGKSSLIKAGLLPHLSSDVVTLYIESTANETESRLFFGLRKRFKTLRDLDLVDTLAALRRGQDLPQGKKLLIVLDQFEQWLHGIKNDEDAELVRALRQCDGARVQCIVTVRDDFWLAVSRFLRHLEVRLVEGENSALADLFDVRHATKVLTAFGRAFHRIPMTSETPQASREFLSQAVTGLTEDGKIVPIRLALFAEIMKSKEWTPNSLRAMGGAAGVGVAFLEETFGATRAPPEHRIHQKAARAVLSALLPESGTDIKGAMRSRAELLAASGYQDRPQDFDSLMRILDAELRLITPTDPEGNTGSDDSRLKMNAPDRYFQLTHDYLVTALRDWLTRKQKETPHGRAELLLADRAVVWNSRPENRQLPSVWQWLRIQRLTKKQSWTAPQQKMMAQATRYHAVRILAVAVLLLVTGVMGWEFNGRLRAENLHNDLLTDPSSTVPDTVRKMAGYRRWVDPLLQQTLAEEVDNSKRLLRARLGLLPVDPSQLPYVQFRFLTCEPEDFSAIRKMLAPYREQLVDDLWTVLQKSKNEGERLRAACALANYDDKNSRWQNVNRDVASILVAESPAVIGHWIEELRPASDSLRQPLGSILADDRRTESERATATSLIAEFAKNDPAAWKKLADGLTQFIDLNRPREERIAEAKRRAHIGVALIQEGHFNLAQPLFEANPDPTARTFLIHGLALPRVRPQVLFDKFEKMTGDPSCRQALLLALGQYDPARIANGERANLIAAFLTAYRTDKHLGVHAAAEWLLREWKEGDQLAAIDNQLREQDRDISRTGANPVDGRQWTMNSQGLTMAIVPAPGEFWVGEGEYRHKRVLRHSYAISTKEVTLKQFLAFREKHVYRKDSARDPDCPALNVTWYDAAAYCNWLSEQEGLPKDQWCYELNDKNDKGEYSPGMKIARDAFNRSGYRLPTEAEWEFVCRAGSVTRYSFGEAEELAKHYAWHLFNALQSSHKVGTLRPNAWGLFDMHGNASEWCQGKVWQVPKGQGGPALEEPADVQIVHEGVTRALRGGSFNSAYPNLGSAYSDRVPPSGTMKAGEILLEPRSYSGFRVSRTIR